MQLYTQGKTRSIICRFGEPRRSPCVDVGRRAAEGVGFQGLELSGRRVSKPWKPMALSQPSDLDFVFDGFEVGVAGDEFGVAEFGQGGGTGFL